jgi:hypothetical protein
MLIVPEVVIGPPVRPVPVATLVTVPVPVGAAHVPSPRQKVVEDAEVPEFRLVTGRLPVTPVARFRPVAFVRVTDEGVPSAGEMSVGELFRTTLPLPVEVVVPVPPLVTFSVPESVTAPLVAVLGAKPVEPALKVVTLIKPGGVAQVPSPRQKVEADAAVPEFRFVTGRLPVTPVESGRFVPFERFMTLGVPSDGETSVALVLRTTLPVPVDVDTPVPPRATGRMPDVICEAAIAILTLDAEVSWP